MNARAEHRRHARQARKSQHLIPSHGHVRFTLNARLVPTLQPVDISSGAVFPGSDYFAVAFGVADRDNVAEWARTAYRKIVHAGVIPPGSGPVALAAACCEHLRDDMAAQLGVGDEVLAQFPLFPAGWLCWIVVPTVPDGAS